MPTGTVVVTGAPTGIGEGTALHLAEQGFRVLAGVQGPGDAQRLSAQGLPAIELDVVWAVPPALSGNRSAHTPLGLSATPGGWPRCPAPA